MITKLSSSCQCHHTVKSLNENQIAAFIHNDSLRAQIFRDNICAILQNDKPEGTL